MANRILSLSAALALAAWLCGCIDMVAAVGERRSHSLCYTTCSPGTHCNEDTGYCDPDPSARAGERCDPDGNCAPLPCGEECPEGQICDTSHPVPHCAEIENTPGVAGDE